MKGGTKHDKGKARYDLLPFDALHEIVLVFTEGANKYGERNWEQGIHYSRLLGAVLRHVSAFAQGKRINEDDFGLHHLAHAAVGCMMLLAYEKRDMTKWNDL